MAETDAALTLLQYEDDSSWRDEAWATAGTATRPNATSVLRRRGAAPERAVRGAVGQVGIGSAHHRVPLLTWLLPREASAIAQALAVRRTKEPTAPRVKGSCPVSPTTRKLHSASASLVLY